MAELDDDRLELLERQLAERITNRVRPALFRLYASVGTAVLIAVGFVSWDIVADIKAEIKTEITDAIDDEIEAKRIEIAERVTEARIMAKRANSVIQRVEKQLDDFQPQADNLDDTIRRVKELNVTSQDLLAAYSQELQPLVANVESLSTQLSTLAEQVDELNRIAENEISEPDDPFLPAPQGRSEVIQSVISDAKAATDAYWQARNKTTVFFQYAGNERDQARALSEALKSENYYIPGEDRELSAEGRHEVRYFHEQDAEAAQQLAGDTNMLIREMEYTESSIPDIITKPLVTYKGKKPRPGVLELWLDLPDVSRR